MRIGCHVRVYSTPDTNMSPYHRFVSEYARLAEEGKMYPLGKSEPLPRPPIPPDAPKVLIFSPHPDDEVIIGGLALRLLREAQWRAIKVGVIRGGNTGGRAEG